VSTEEFNAGGDPTIDYPSYPGRSRVHLVALSCYRNRDKLWPDGPLGSYTDFKLPFIFVARRFMAGSQMLRQLYFSALDMELHTRYEAQKTDLT